MPIRSAIRILSADRAALLLISTCWITAIILVNPLGEFPVVDDWAYLNSVRALVERGELSFSDFAAQNLISHLIWGGLFSFPFGASYTALRVSTLVAALFAAFALFKLMRNVEQPVSTAAFAALLFLFNPIFFALSFSFMTDVPFVAAQVGAMLFLLWGLNGGSRTKSALGWLLAVAAQLSRQTAFAIPIGYAGAYLVKHGLTVRRIALAALPILIFIGVQWIYEQWLAASGHMSLAYGKTLNTALPRLMKPAVLGDKLWDISRYMFFYLGLFLLPLSVPLLATALQSLKRWQVALAACAMAVTSAALSAYALSNRVIMPVWPHTWRDRGIGAESHDVVPPLIALQTVTVLAIVGGVCLVILLATGAYRLCMRRELLETRAQGLAFGIVATAALAGAVSLVHPVFDRYLLPLIPCVVLAVACAVPEAQSKVPRWTLGVSGVLLTVMASFVVIALHNYASEKRVIAAAIGDLLAQGVPRERIDAGWVWNGEHAFGRFKSGDHYYKSWYLSRDYVVTVRRTEPNYLLLRTYPVPRWRLWGRGGSAVYTYGPQVAE